MRLIIALVFLLAVGPATAMAAPIDVKAWLQPVNVTTGNDPAARVYLSMKNVHYATGHFKSASAKFFNAAGQLLFTDSESFGPLGGHSSRAKVAFYFANSGAQFPITVKIRISYKVMGRTWTEAFSVSTSSPGYPRGFTPR